MKTNTQKKELQKTPNQKSKKLKSRKTQKDTPIGKKTKKNGKNG